VFMFERKAYDKERKMPIVGTKTLVVADALEGRSAQYCGRNGGRGGGRVRTDTKEVTLRALFDRRFAGGDSQKTMGG